MWCLDQGQVFNHPKRFALAQRVGGRGVRVIEFDHTTAIKELRSIVFDQLSSIR
jgi:hypothetical protein